MISSLQFLLLHFMTKCCECNVLLLAVFVLQRTDHSNSWEGTDSGWWCFHGYCKSIASGRVHSMLRPGTHARIPGIGGIVPSSSWQHSQHCKPDQRSGLYPEEQSQVLADIPRRWVSHALQSQRNNRRLFNGSRSRQREYHSVCVAFGLSSACQCRGSIDCRCMFSKGLSVCHSGRR